MKIKLLFLCKASVTEGLGHLIRSLTLADYIAHHHPQIDISFVLISDLSLEHKLDDKSYKTKIISGMGELSYESIYDTIILDMLSMDENHFQSVKSKSNKVVSISPIFNLLHRCDLLITRTIYHTSNDNVPSEVLAGLQYNIIRKDCQQIPLDKYASNLRSNDLHIAISMGGTDPNNRTLEVVKVLKGLKSDAVFWVMIGEGYVHKLRDLIQEINQDSQHEIIICKTNKSMWKVMANCQLAILSGGITSYESAYAGLPAINYFQNKEKAYLVKELEDQNLCLPICYSLEEMPNIIEGILSSKDRLLQIHNNCKMTFTRDTLENVCSAIGIDKQ